MNQQSPSHDPSFAAITREQVERIEKGAWYHSIALPDGRVIPGLIPVEALRKRLDAYGLPEDLSGQRALDVGAATGWCSFELERRGARVLAVDCVEYDDFRVAHKLAGSGVEYAIIDVDEMTPAQLGTFDIILFFGVLYHLRHPLLGLERMLALTNGAALVESFVSDGHLPEAEWRANGCSMEFYETTELGGQIDNWVGPTVNCLLALCRAAGFARVELKYVENRRAGVLCQRSWEPEPAPAQAEDPTPVVSSAISNRTGTSDFGHGKDEYICLYFQAAREGICREDLRVEVAGKGAPVITLTRHEGSGWLQANLRVPVDLAPGAHAVRVRLSRGRFSEPVEIRVGARTTPRAHREAPALTPNFYLASNGLSASNEFRPQRSSYVRCCFELDAAELDPADIVVELAGRQLQPFFVGRDVAVSRQGSASSWQANVRLPADLAPGAHTLRLRTVTGEWSGAMEIQVVPD